VVCGPFSFSGTRHEQPGLKAPCLQLEPPSAPPGRGDLDGVLVALEVRR
jgi:hypothetical protein